MLMEVIRSVPNLRDPYRTLGALHEVMGQQRQALNYFIIAAHMGRGNQVSVCACCLGEVVCTRRNVREGGGRGEGGGRERGSGWGVGLWGAQGALYSMCVALGVVCSTFVPRLQHAPFLPPSLLTLMISIQDTSLWHKLALMSEEQGFLRQAIYCWNKVGVRGREMCERERLTC